MSDKDQSVSRAISEFLEDLVADGRLVSWTSSVLRDLKFEYDSSERPMTVACGDVHQTIDIVIPSRGREEVRGLEGLGRRDQPSPVPNTRPAIWDLVVEDMRARDAEGLKRYGTRLQALNGRDGLRDLYEELLDAVVYCRQVIEERCSDHDLKCVVAEHCRECEAENGECHDRECRWYQYKEAGK